MSPIEFWLLADRLIQNEPNPAGFRSAVSRAYYAAFLTSLNFLDEAGIVFPRTLKKGDLHRLAPDLLSNSGDAEVVAAGAILGDLRDERNRADYDYWDASIENDHHARLRHGDAGTIIGKLNAC